MADGEQWHDRSNDEVGCRIVQPATTAAAPNEGQTPSPRVREKRAGEDRAKSSHRFDQHGLPKAEPHPSYLQRPSLVPDTDDDQLLRREVLLSQVELLLLQGAIKPWRIAKLVGIHETTAKRYIEAIHVRWATEGQFGSLKQLRGEARARLDVITEELWRVYASTGSDVVKVAAMKHLLDVHDRILLLDNLTPRTIEMLAQDRGDASYGPDVESLMQDHERMLQLSVALIRHVGTGAKPAEELDSPNTSRS